jgi:UDP-glucose:(glucosyl)LPS alpha-1,2-glucosyltransferase
MHIIDGMLERSDVTKNAKGASEIVAGKLVEGLGEKLKGFQIVFSRLKFPLDPNKVRLFYAHDLPEDPESSHLQDEGWNQYHKLVFCSNWQQQQYIERYNIPWSRTVVIKNAIDPIDVNLLNKMDRKNNKINIVYHTTPHRGLELLLPVFEKLAEKYDNIHLHVFSSFKIYGWDQRDEGYQKLFDRIKSHSQMTYHGFVSNEQLRDHLKEMDIFAYPSIWKETSCISLMEAMSAGLACAHPNLGALYETSSNWTFMYNWIEVPNEHAMYFYHFLDSVINVVVNNTDQYKNSIINQKGFIDVFYNWKLRLDEWGNFLDSMRNVPTELPKTKTEYFQYKTL